MECNEKKCRTYTNKVNNSHCPACRKEMIWRWWFNKVGKMFPDSLDWNIYCAADPDYLYGMWKSGKTPREVIEFIISKKYCR